MATVENEWIIPLDDKNNEVLRNGVRVRRTFAGFNAAVDKPDENGKSLVTDCTVSYHYRELYPTGEVIKDEIKAYTLQDLAATTGTDEGGDWVQEAYAVLSYFISIIGQESIVNSSRSTLSSADTLPLNAEPNYPLRRDTREKVYQPAP